MTDLAHFDTQGAETEPQDKGFDTLVVVGLGLIVAVVTWVILK